MFIWLEVEVEVADEETTLEVDEEEEASIVSLMVLHGVDSSVVDDEILLETLPVIGVAAATVAELVLAWIGGNAAVTGATVVATEVDGGLDSVRFCLVDLIKFFFCWVISDCVCVIKQSKRF